MTRDEQMVLTEAEFTSHYAGMDVASLGYQALANRDGVASRFVNTERNSFNAAGVKIAERDALGTERTYAYDAAQSAAHDPDGPAGHHALRIRSRHRTTGTA